MTFNISRRSALRIGGVGGLSALALSRAGLSYAAGPKDRPLLVVILRGALDGLAAVPKYDDQHIMDLRGELIPSDKGGALTLDDGFALHPALTEMHKMYKAGELSFMHAAAVPNASRSHFDAQDLLETAKPGGHDGWLNRALSKASGNIEAIGVGGSLPLILRGEAAATSWAPPTLPDASDDTLARLMDLYEGDPLLGPGLIKALDLEEKIMFSGGMEMGGRKNIYGQNSVPIFTAAANLFKTKAAGAVAMSLNGWDTHANQGAETGILSRRLSGLDTGLSAFKTQMGARWKNTAVLVMTEFGRTVRVNGTKGTDHGTAGAAFLMGGAVNGGKMIGDWPGLSAGALFENRDLRGANDLQGLIAGVLHAHWQIEAFDLKRHVFAQTTDIRSGLIRGA